MKRVLRKLRSREGFSLAEMLITVLILLMVSAVVAGGVPAAVNAYKKAVDAANAHSLLSTTVNALRRELSTAWDVSVSGNKIKYYSSDTGSQSEISVVGDRIMLQEYYDWEAFDSGTAVTKPAQRPLVTDATAIKGKLRITYDKAYPDKGMITITGLKVFNTEASGEAPIAKMPDIDGKEAVLQIRVITGGT